MTPELLAILAALAGLAPLPGMAGQAFTYLGIGLLPGLAAAGFLLPNESRAVRWTAGLALSPVLATSLAWFLVRAGLTFRTTTLVLTFAAAAAVLFTSVLRARRPADLPAPGVPRGVLGWAAGLAAVLVLVPVLNPWLFVRSDGWIHGGIVMELLERGFPPEDARMAGVRLNYVWFFNFFIALLHSIRAQDLFRFMTLFNAATAFATVVLTALAARRLWRDDRVALAAAVVLTLGLNAGTFVLWPLSLLRALSGEVRGMPEVLRQWHTVHWNTWEIIYSLSAPFGGMINFLDKLMVGTALGYAYLQMTLWLWALLAWLDEGRRAFLLLAAIGSAGTMLFHSVVGLSAIPLGLGVLALAWLAASRWRWMPERRRLVAVALATLAGFAVTFPYLRSITAGWAPERAGFRFSFFGLHWTAAWTLATACAFVIAWSIGPLRTSWREKRPLPVLVGAWAVAIAVFAFLVTLPQHNDVKFVYEFFCAGTLLAAPRALEVARSHLARPRAATALLLVLWLTPTILTLHGYLVDPEGRSSAELHPAPGETEVYRWLSTTPKDAVVVDRDFRDLVAVRAGRRLYLGTNMPPDLAAFPAAEMARRREAMRDLYGPFVAPDSTVARLTALGRPVFVLYRPGDPPAIDAPWRRLTAAAPRARVVYDRDGFHVVEIPAGGAS